MQRFVLLTVLLLVPIVSLNGCKKIQEKLFEKATTLTEQAAADLVAQEEAPPEPGEVEEPEEPQGLEGEDEETAEETEKEIVLLDAGDKGDFGGVEITVTQLKWHGGDAFNKPGEEERWLAIEVEVHNTTDKMAMVNAATNFQLLNPENEKMNNLSISPVVEIDALAGIEAGEQKRGWLLFSVLEADDSWTLVCEERAVGTVIEDPGMVRFAISKEEVVDLVDGADEGEAEADAGVEDEGDAEVKAPDKIVPRLPSKTPRPRVKDMPLPEGMRGKKDGRRPTPRPMPPGRDLRRGPSRDLRPSKDSKLK